MPDFELYFLVVFEQLTDTFNLKQTVPASKQIAGMNSSLVVDIPVMLLVMALLTIPALAKKKLTRTQGIGLLVIYAAFCVYQFAL